MVQNTIFKAQPGLKRRTTWEFNIDGYTKKGLSEIFKRQTVKSSWQLCKSIDLEIFFDKYKQYFKYFGGDTQKLLQYCKLNYSTSVVDNFLSQNTNEGTDISMNVSSVFSQQVLESAMDSFIDNHDKMITDEPPEHMYG